MKYTELTIRKKQTDEYLLTLDTYEVLDNYIHTIAKDFFIESLGDTVTYLHALAKVDPEVRVHVEGRGNLHRRFHAAKRDSIVFSIRWDGSYLDRPVTSEPAGEPPKKIASDDLSITNVCIGWHVSWLHGSDWKDEASNDGEVQ